MNTDLRKEEEAHAGDAGFGFLQLGDVDSADGECGLFQAGARRGETVGHEDDVVELEDVGGPGFGDVDQRVVGEGGGVDPISIDEERAASEVAGAAFQVQTAADVDGADVV